MANQSKETIARHKLLTLQLQISACQLHLGLHIIFVFLRPSQKAIKLLKSTETVVRTYERTKLWRDRPAMYQRECSAVCSSAAGVNAVQHQVQQHSTTQIYLTAMQDRALHLWVRPVQGLWLSLGLFHTPRKLRAQADCRIESCCGLRMPRQVACQCCWQVKTFAT